MAREVPPGSGSKNFCLHDTRLWPLGASPRHWLDSPQTQGYTQENKCFTGRTQDCVRFSWGPMAEFIRIQGARQNNLKDISLDIPRDQLVVITGLSGSGKSSLAFDTIYAEGQRRYVESLSAYARQFLGQMDKPDVDHIEGLSPAVSIDQKSTSKNPRSTVGTVTEIYDYLRLLFARVGVPHDPVTGKPLTKQTVEQMVDRTLELPEGTRIQILAPVVRGRKGEYKKEIEEIRQEGFARARIDGTVYDLSSDEIPDLARYKQHTIEIVIDRLVMKTTGLEKRLADSLETAAKRGKGQVVVDVMGGEALEFTESFAATDSAFNFEEIEPRLFSFNSPYGACPECHGLGIKTEFDPDLIVPDKSKSINAGAIFPYVAASSGNTNEWARGLFEGVAERFGFSLDAPLETLTPEQFGALMHGVKGTVTVTFRNKWGRNRQFTSDFSGVVGMLQKRRSETDSDNVKEWLAQYQADKPCPVCKGKRLKPEALAVMLGGFNISDLCALSIEKAYDWFEGLTLTARQQIIGRQIVREVQTRLGFLLNVGLSYLTLDRGAATLAGGEAQRIRLASQIGSGLTGVLYILDEPSIGLHQRDNTKLIETLMRLRGLGNTIIVVEHDEETMAAADWIVDIGPGAGEHGGQVVAQGTPEQIMANPESVTGRFLSGRDKIDVPAERRAPNGKSLEVKGARGHNLQNVNVSVPLGCFVCVTGVSGSGKSTLIQETLFPRLQSIINKSHHAVQPFDSITGIEHLDKIVDIDQSPIGRTPRSNPATYTGVFDMIRDLFAKTADARMRGYKPGRFSFNVKGGRCEACKGDGIIKIEMQFLPDVYVPCEVCHGRRYNRETLEVKYKGKSIADILEMTVGQAVQFFEPVPAITRKLKTIHDVGLDYIRMGQPATQLSGGEAQRVKLATELAKRATGRTLYILDEPTTGLHFADVKKLLQVLQRLADTGNSVLVIEHNLDVIKTADWVIDMGPEGGDGGGRIVAEGTPEEVAQVKASHTGRYLAKVLSGQSLITGK
jgi:excinuclease ABC subunit A